MDLGDVIAEHLQRNYRIIDDEETTGYLRRVGENLIKHLPPTSLHFQFFLFESPDVDAFTLPGGRIYVSRKLVAFVGNEDELAGVIAHELGHVVARHGALSLSLLFKEVLGVTQVNDRKDIFEKYNQLIENTGRKPKAFEKTGGHDEGTQNVADLIGLYTLALAGYNPQAQTQLWDRLTETKGKTGNFFSNLFGSTKPEQKRLREMQKGIASLAAYCLGPRSASTNSEFARWQNLVINYTSTKRTEALRGVLAKSSLNPALRSDINHLRFSADGKYLLAQDDSGINVLTREPFAPLFRINSSDAKPAQFTPDSRAIIFHTSNLRVEEWDLAQQKLRSAHELVVRRGCLQTALSPDGKTLACLDGDFNLNLLDVATGNQIFQKKSFYKAQFSDVLALIFMTLGSDDTIFHEDQFIKMSFSPDAHYFTAGDRVIEPNAMSRAWVSTYDAFAFDLTSSSVVQIKGDLKKIIASGFAFVGPDKIVGKDWENTKRSGLYTFPAGEVIENFDVLTDSLKSTTKGNYVLLAGLTKPAGAALDLASKKTLGIQNQKLLDVYNQVAASERGNGELALYEMKGGPPKVIALPQNSLGRLYAVDVSPDLRFLALSGWSRGAVWDVEKQRLVFYLRGFRGAYFSDDGTLYADFPEYHGTERNITHLNGFTRQTDLGPKVESYNSKQYGSVIVTLKHQGESGSKNSAMPLFSAGGDLVLDVRDTRTASSLWSTTFPSPSTFNEEPGYSVASREGVMVVWWPTSAKPALAEIRTNPTLNQQLSGMKDRETNYYLKVLDLRSGKPQGQLLVDTGKGSFRIRGAYAAKDWLMISDSENRTLVYSLATGQQKGKVFGRRVAVSASSNLLCVQNESGLLSLYDLQSSEKREQFSFPSPVSVASFSSDGKRLLVVTSDQNVYTLDMTPYVTRREQ